MSKLVSHEVSKFGRFDIVFHSEAEIFYNLLKDKGLIDYLKDLDHLGFITKAHPGNNHKRWDYVMLQLYLLHKLKDGVFKYGLSNNCKIDEDTEISSGLSLIQIAILFSNIGHLPGTIAAEKALYHYLEENPNRKTEFLSPFIDNIVWKSFSDNVFDNHDFYKVKHLIAANFTYKYVADETLRKSIEFFFKGKIDNDPDKLKKFKWLFLKIRQVSFIYLDSFNSDFPFHIDISKILLNLFNYKTLFNTNSKDFDGFFETCETSLSKKLYLSERSAINLKHNEELFKKHLKSEFNRGGENKLKFDDFIINYTGRAVPDFRITDGNGHFCYQFYLSKEDINIFGNRLRIFDYDTAFINLFNRRNELESLINRKLENKNHKISLIQDQRRTLFYNNLLIDKVAIKAEEIEQFMLNYLKVHLEFINEFKNSNTEGHSHFKDLDLATNNLLKHYSRKVFLQLFKFLFSYKLNLSVYVKFENQNLISKLFQAKNINGTGYVKGKSKLINLFNDLSGQEYIPADIKNNHNILKWIVENEVEIDYNFNAFYCLFPLEVEKHEEDIEELHKHQNFEKITTITDIDAALLIFSKSKFEFYIIEGKDSGNLVRDVNKDFKKIKKNFHFNSNFPEVKIVNQTDAKGGYIKYSI